MQQPGFSVVIPAYNYAHCVARAVRSVLAQDYPLMQCLVVNDGSKDNTLEVLRDLQQQGLAFDLVDQANAGLAAVRNRGIDEARHDWLVFLDADDEMLPGALDCYAKAIALQPEAALVIGAHESVFDDGRVRRVTPASLPSTASARLHAYLFKHLSIANGACAMHRRCFDRLRYRVGMRQSEDVPVFAHVLAHYPVITLQEPVARIYKHADSMRHDTEQALKVGMQLEQVIFEESGLPAWATSLRRRYRARRALSLVKHCYRGGDYQAVVRFWHEAFRTAPLAALSPRYLRRYLSSLVKR